MTTDETRPEKAHEQLPSADARVDEVQSNPAAPATIATSTPNPTDDTTHTIHTTTDKPAAPAAATTTTTSIEPASSATPAAPVVHTQSLRPATSASAVAPSPAAVVQPASKEHTQHTDTTHEEPVPSTEHTAVHTTAHVETPANTTETASSLPSDTTVTAPPLAEPVQSTHTSEDAFTTADESHHTSTPLTSNTDNITPLTEESVARIAPANAGRPTSLLSYPLTHPNGASIFPTLTQAEQEDLAREALDQAQNNIIAESFHYQGYNDDVSDGGYESDGNSSASTSAESSVRDYLYENGRRYHSFREGTYNFPNDDVEQEREDMKHAMVKLLCSQKLHFSPLNDHPQQILDIGTGTGIWAIESKSFAPLSCIMLARPYSQF